MIVPFLVGVIVGCLIALYVFRRERFAPRNPKEDKLDPGFGLKLGDMMKTPAIGDHLDTSIDQMASDWTEGSFGKLVSALEERERAPEIHNLV